MTANSLIPLIRTIPGSIMDRRRIWYVFRVFNIYRLVLVTGLLVIFFLDEYARLFGTTYPTLFLGTAVAYIAMVLASIVTSYLRRPTLKMQAHIQTLVDIIGISLLIHSSGGIANSLTVLLVTAVAVGGILLPLHSALLAATIAFFMMLGGWLYTLWLAFTAITGPGALTGERIAQFINHIALHSDELGHLGVLGAACFIATLLTYTLAERTRHSEELVRQRTQELLEVAELNQAIVQHLQSGIIVVDHQTHIKLMNSASQDLLDYHKDTQGLPLGAISAVLNQRLDQWLNAGVNNPAPFRQDEHLPDVTPSFAKLDSGSQFDTLIFLEDSTQAAQRLQQIKLAALGRMTASIAHEIRNPLAAISHAAQLLEESPSSGVTDRRLRQIIYDNAKRANQIISNVMDLSRRDKAKPEDVPLKAWLSDFVRDFLRSQGEPAPHIHLHSEPDDLVIRFDPTQLHQVLWNLCANACIHGVAADHSVRIELSAGTDRGRSRPRLDVIDFGPGIPEAEAKKIFEPFFTTGNRGTGLGLYISREICEANHAQLQYLRAATGGSCFRITFAQASRQDMPWKLAMS